MIAGITQILKRRTHTALKPTPVVAEEPPDTGRNPNHPPKTDTLRRLRDRLQEARDRFDDGVWFRLAEFKNVTAAWHYEKKLSEEFEGIAFKPTLGQSRSRTESTLYAKFES